MNQTLRHPDLSPTMDLVAKKIFNQTDITAAFIADIFNLPVKTATILENDQIHLLEAPFLTAVDVLVELDDGTQVIIEIQVAKQKNFLHRLWAYVNFQVAENMELLQETGQTHKVYSELTPVYAIAILEKSIFPDQMEAFNSYSLRNDLTNQALLFDFKKGDKRPPIRLAFLELDKYNKGEKQNYTIKRWLEFFGNKPFTEKPDRIIQKAEHLLDKASWTREERSMLSQQRIQNDIQNLTLEYQFDLGMEQGIEKGTEILIKTMSKNGADQKTISEMTDLPIEKIEEILG